MTELGKKTPVSILQEYFVLRKALPRYELVKNGVGTHNPEFIYRVKVGLISEEGAGKSKQIAKHRAAEKMLKRLNIIEGSTDEIGMGFAQVEIGNDNYVGLLSEYCSAKFHPEPKYFVEEEAGPSHSKIFKMVCSVSQLQDFGIASTKKSAKQQAAFKMLERLKKLTSEKNASDDAELKEIMQKATIKIPEISLTDEEIINKYNVIRPANAAIAKKPEAFYKDYHKAYLGLEQTSQSLSKLLEEVDLDYENCLNILYDIATELEASIKSTAIPCTNSDSNYIVLTMSVVPPIAALGVNEKVAAYNLLQSLRTLCIA